MKKNHHLYNELKTRFWETYSNPRLIAVYIASDPEQKSYIKIAFDQKSVYILSLLEGRWPSNEITLQSIKHGLFDHYPIAVERIMGVRV